MNGASDGAYREALIVLGGCEHTPEPFKGCDTCGRPPRWLTKHASVAAFAWQAELLDGRVLDRRDVLSVANLPIDQVVRLNIRTDDFRVPLVRLSVDPRKGERLYMFTRHCHRSTGERVSVLVFEVKKDAAQSGDFVRLYLHPVDGPILSTEDLYF